MGETLTGFAKLFASGVQLVTKLFNFLRCLVEEFVNLVNDVTTHPLLEGDVLDLIEGGHWLFGAIHAHHPTTQLLQKCGRD